MTAGTALFSSNKYSIAVVCLAFILNGCGGGNGGSSGGAVTTVDPWAACASYTLDTDNDGLPDCVEQLGWNVTLA